MGDPTVTIVMDDDSKEADVEPGESGLVVFTGTVYVEPPAVGGAGQWYRVDLNTTSLQGWATVISPSSIQFTNSGGSSALTVSARVPPETPCTEEDTLTIGGTCTTTPGGQTSDIPDETVTVTVGQYYLFDIHCDDPEVTTSGGTESYIIEILNNGNGVDEFEILVGNQEILNSKDISVRISPDTVILQSMFSEEVKVRVTNGDGTDRYDEYTIKILVDSHGSLDEGIPLHEVVFLQYELEGRNYGDVINGAIVMIIIVLVVAGVMLLRRRKMRRMQALIARMREEEEE